MPYPTETLYGNPETEQRIPGPGDPFELLDPFVDRAAIVHVAMPDMSTNPQGQWGIITDTPGVVAPFRQGQIVEIATRTQGGDQTSTTRYMGADGELHTFGPREHGLPIEVSTRMQQLLHSPAEAAASTAATGDALDGDTMGWEVLSDSLYPSTLRRIGRRLLRAVSLGRAGRPEDAAPGNDRWSVPNETVTSPAAEAYSGRHRANP